MRICFVAREYPPETAGGGIGSQTYVKAHGLAALGHEVSVISRSTDHQRREYHDGAVQIIRVADLSSRLPLYTQPAYWLTYSAEAAVAVWDLHTRTPLDIVDFPEWGGEGYIHLLNQTEWNHIPTVIHLHGPVVMLAHTIGWPEIDSEFYRVGTMMEGTCVRLADAVFSSSRCSTDWCATHYGLDRDRTPTLHTGVDTQLFSPRSLPKASRPTIIFVGKVVRNKGIDVLVEAACLLANDYPDLHVRVLGRGDANFITELQTKALAAGAPHLLDMVGFVDRQELPCHLSQAHIFAAPSVYEGGPGFVYLEAMACGLPVVACDSGGATEVVLPEENGLVVPPGDVNALVKALHRLLSHPEECREMGNRARRYALAEADSNKCIRRMEVFYSNVVSSKGPRAAM